MVGSAAFLGALFFAGYLALVQYAAWQSNPLHQSGSPLSTKLPDLPELSLSATEFPAAPDLEEVSSEFDSVDVWLPILHTWETQMHGEPRQIVFRGAPAMSNPGSATAMVQLFAKNQKKLGEWTFWPGPDIEETQVSFHRDDDFGGDVIAIASRWQDNRRDTFMQVFAFSSDVLFLIRLENDAGRIVPNWYYPGCPLGVLPGAKEVDEWIAMLESRDEVLILAALTYLAGRFDSATRPQSWFGDPESLKTASIRVLRANERIRALVSRHAIDDRRWIREAAQLASETLR